MSKEPLGEYMPNEYEQDAIGLDRECAALAFELQQARAECDALRADLEASRLIARVVSEVGNECRTLRAALKTAHQFIETRGHTDECILSESPDCKCGYHEAYAYLQK